MPRTGGIALLAGAAVSLAFGALAVWLPLGLALALAVVSLSTMCTGCHVARFGAHPPRRRARLVRASPMHPLEMALLIVAVAWITNLYNFMDGSDGLAGGMAAIGFAAYGLAAWWGDALALAAACVAISSAAVAFLLHNHHPARIFLGDVGSILLGFLAAALGVFGWREDLWPLWFPLLVFGPFIGDATLTLVRRLLRRERVWQAHRDHYYQRMVRMGFGHRATAWTGYAVMLVRRRRVLAQPGAGAAGDGVFGASALLAALAVCSTCAGPASSAAA